MLATELGVKTVFLDDRRGRKVAQSAGLQVTGIAGFLLFAKQSAKIEAVQPLLLQLHQKGFSTQQQTDRRGEQMSGRNSDLSDRLIRGRFHTARSTTPLQPQNRSITVGVFIVSTFNQILSIKALPLMS